MYLAVKDVKPQENYKLLLTFANDEVKIFDVSKYLEIGKFKELKDKSLFQSVRVPLQSMIRSNVRITLIDCKEVSISLSSISM